jgi:hypothetical protein
MRLRNSALTESGLLSARDTDAVETPARAATARMPCFDDLADNVSRPQGILGNRFHKWQFGVPELALAAFRLFHAAPRGGLLSQRENARKIVGRHLPR